MPTRFFRTWCAAALLVLSSAASVFAQAPTTVILVRHAEKAAAQANDPPLTDAGRARADALLSAVRDAGVDAIITTQFVRTRETAAPTAAALHVTPEVVSASGSSHVQDVATAVKKHTGHTVLVVGHSNTVPAIIAALGAPEPRPICDAEYDDLFIVQIPADGSHARLIHAKYGAPSNIETCSAMK